MVAHGTQIAAAVGVTHHAALDVGVGGGGEGLQAVEVTYVTSLSAAVDIPIHGAAEQVDVGGAADGGSLTIAAAVGIARDESAFQDVDVGVVFLFLMIEVFRPAGFDIQCQLGERKVLGAQATVVVVAADGDVQPFLVRV